MAPAALTERWAEAAAGAGGAVDHFFDVAGFVVRLRFAGPALVEETTAALEHLRTPARDDPALTVHVWDSASTGVEPPDGPWTAAPDGNVRGSDPAGFFERWNEMLSVLDSRSGVGHHWARSAIGDPSAPLSSILGFWLAQHGIQLVHAGAVGTAEGCVMLVGAGGAGKSTAARAAMTLGLGLIGDDTCLAGPQAPPLVMSLYCSAQDATPNGRTTRFLAAEDLLPNAPLRGVAHVVRTGEESSRTVPIGRAEAAAAVAPRTTLMSPGDPKLALSRLAGIAQSVPGYRLEAGTDTAGLARAIEALL